MASLLNARVARPEIPAPSAPENWPEGLVQHKLTRLLELRAVIDAMRSETEAQDPLLSWVIARERTHAS